MCFAMLRSAAKALSQKLPVVFLYLGSTSSMAVGLATQSIGFIVLARFLGNAQFGQLATITAVGGLGAAWVQLGSFEAMRRRVGRDPSVYGAILGHCLTLIFGWGIIVALLCAAATAAFVHLVSDPLSNFFIVLLFTVTNLILFPWISLTEQIFLAHGSFTRGNFVTAGFGIVRALTAVVACIGFGVQSLSSWAVWNCAAYIVGALMCAIAVAPYGVPRLGILRDEITIGFTFGISGFLVGIRSSIDILALTAVAPLATVGEYGLAKRIIGMAAVSGASLDRLVYTKLAIAGQEGPSQTLKLARRYMVYAAALTGATSIALFVFSPLLPFIFGDHFNNAIGILKTLCWTLVLYGAQNIAFDSLNAANCHRLQVIVSTGAVLVGTSAVAALTLHYGLNGTYVGVYLAEILTASSLWGGLIMAGRRSKGAAVPHVPPA